MIKKFTLNNIETVAKEIWEHATAQNVWAFHAEMGAGKTTFIHTLCQHLGVTSAIGSPTYSIINEYKSNAGIIYHMDWYRMKDEEEAMQAGVEDCLYSNNLCLIEWPERAERLLPETTFHVYIEVVDEQTRTISYQ